MDERDKKSLKNGFSAEHMSWRPGASFSKNDRVGEQHGHDVNSCTFGNESTAPWSDQNLIPVADG
jgi:hypothetical protein